MENHTLMAGIGSAEWTCSDANPDVTGVVTVKVSRKWKDQTWWHMQQLFIAKYDVGEKYRKLFTYFSTMQLNYNNWKCPWNLEFGLVTQIYKDSDFSHQILIEEWMDLIEEFGV